MTPNRPKYQIVGLFLKANKQMVGPTNFRTVSDGADLQLWNRPTAPMGFVQIQSVLYGGIGESVTVRHS